MTERSFQQKFLNPLPNTDCECFSHVLALQANYIRNITDESFANLPDEPRHAFREMAAEYAELLGIDAFKAKVEQPTDD